MGRETVLISHRGGSYQEPLYKLLEERPEIYFCHHNPASGAFYIRFGCANCNSMTGYDSPQYEDALLDKCPPNVEGKYLKQVDEVRSALREFIGQVLGWNVPASRCRHRHIADEPREPLQALANQAHAA